MASRHSPRQNKILAALPDQDYATRVSYLYSPTSSLVSLLCIMENGTTTEIAISGNESLVGIALFMGGETTPSRAVVQGVGHGYRLRAKVAKREFAFGSGLHVDRLEGNEVATTQELIASMLGVRCEGVTDAARD